MSRREDISNRYLPSSVNNDKDIDDTLLKMLGKTSLVGTTNPQFCGECGEKCTIAYPNPKDDTVVYCKTHYEELVAPICEGCGRGVIGEVSVMGGKKYHPACYNKDHQCARCSQPIIGESTVAMNKNFHPRCFTCTACNVSLGPSYIDRVGSAYCSKCNADLSDPEKSKHMLHGSGAAVIATTNKAAEERNKIKTDLYANVQGGKEACNWCRKIITAHAVQFDGKVFHEDCFMCTGCSKPIGSNSFVNRNGSPCCQDCGKPAATLCTGCSKPITSTYTMASGSKYHPQCLTCSKCKKSLEKGYAEKEGHFYCGVCICTAPSSTTTQSTQLSPGRTKGFVIDPRSGKKTFL